MLTDEEKEKVQTLLGLDEGNLDQECLRHARRSFRWLMLEADAKQEVSLAKARLDLAEARVKRAARLDPASFGLKDKPTVGDLAEAVTLSKDYQDALAEVQAAEHHADQVKGVVTALAEKRRAIERLVELKQIDYYAEPRPKVGADAMQQSVRREVRIPLGRKAERAE